MRDKLDAVAFQCYGMPKREESVDVEFALIMLRNGVDIFALQKLMGHSDLQVLRRYLAQADEDVHMAHMSGSAVDNNL